MDKKGFIMKNIKILDCTLRDGGYINNWEFDNKEIQMTSEHLLKSNIDIIECGFLDKTKGKVSDSTRFETFESANSVLNSLEVADDQLIVSMVEFGKFDIDELPTLDKNVNIKGIRYSFRKSDFDHARSDMEKVKEKGYQLFVQPISTNSYTEIELMNLITVVNELSPYAIYIVDTQGSMFKDDFRRLYYQFDKLINKDIAIGFHSHNNMQLSYSIAIDFIEIARYRDIIIDSSVYGMGRGAGNLNTELLADYINKKINNKYQIENILELIDKYYYTLYIDNEWGYSLAHFLSASLECHPNYASFLLNKKNLSINEIRSILLNIPKEESFEYNKTVIENLYFEFNSNYSFDVIEPVLNIDKKILLLGPGKSIETKLSYIKENRDKYIIVSLNHIPNELNVDYSFFSSQKRFSEFENELEKEKTIISSNLDIKNNVYILDYKQLASINNIHNDNSVVMMINYLSTKGIADVELAGIDGFSVSEDNYNYKETDKVVDKKAIQELNKYILDGLKLLSKRINIIFLTESIFKKAMKQRVIGVIPSRISSTRLPKKPLVDILGLPMVIHVMKRAMMSDVLDDVVVATDSEEILDTVESYGGKAVMTSEDHQNGTLRMQEVSTKISGDLYVLLNGDEPLIEPKFIEESVNGLLSSNDAVASLLITPYYERNNQSNFKVAINNFNEVMYISRNDIPSDARRDLKPMWKAFHVVSYRKDFLDKYANELEQTEFDEREMDDQLRILEYGYKIKAVKTQSDAISVDTKEDLSKVIKIMETDELFKLYRENI